MPRTSPPNAEVIDLAPGLWIWRLQHPAWGEGRDWQQVVTSVCVDAGDERWVIDPLLPPDATSQVWQRFAERAPTAVAVLLGDHLRETWTDRNIWSNDALARRFGCRNYGPNALDPEMIEEVGPIETEVREIVPGRKLPGGLLPFRDPRGFAETPIYLPEHKALVFGDAMTERAGSLRVWMSRMHEERALPDLKAMLELPFERVIISHGEPVHSREAFERALELPPWPASSLHILAWRGDLDQVRKMVERGADMAVQSDDGRTPLEWARGGGHDDVIAYLESQLRKI